MKNENLKNNAKYVNEKMYYDLGRTIGNVSTKLRELDKHFTNHLHDHRLDRALQAIYFALTIIMFCILSRVIK